MGCSVSLSDFSTDPRNKLIDIWEKHMHMEFEAKDVSETMATMCAGPIINHVPTMSGGVGYDEVRSFYKHHFIHANPSDCKISLVSRTVDTTEGQIVDEMIFSFTHSTQMDWMLPGITPTYRPVQIPLVVVVKFCGSKISAERVYWDQASVLLQLDLLPNALNLPVLGAETAHKILYPSLPARELGSWKTVSEAELAEGKSADEVVAGKAKGEGAKAME